MDGWPSDSTVNVGDVLGLLCKAGNGGTPISFTWYKDDSKIISLGTTGAILQMTIQDTSFAGDYKCKAINADGSTDSITQTLIVGKAGGELK